MISFERWEILGNFFKDNIEGVKSYVSGAADEDITEVLQDLKNSEYPVLLGIIPSADSTSKDMDNRSHSERWIYYLLYPIKNDSASELSEKRNLTQEKIQEIETLVFDNYVEVPEFRRVVENSFHYDPEYGIWNHFGWSVSFVVENA